MIVQTLAALIKCIFKFICQQIIISFHFHPFQMKAQERYISLLKMDDIYFFTLLSLSLHDIYFFTFLSDCRYWINVYVIVKILQFITIIKVGQMHLKLYHCFNIMEIKVSFLRVFAIYFFKRNVGKCMKHFNRDNTCTDVHTLMLKKIQVCCPKNYALSATLYAFASYFSQPSTYLLEISGRCQSVLIRTSVIDMVKG